MNRQRAQQTQQNAVPQQRNTLLRHVAVQPVADQELSFNESARGLEHDFSQLPASPAISPLGQPASNASCSVSPQRCPFGGACHSCPPHIQAKLKIGQPGDKYEQEADRVAEQVMRMPEPQVQRKEGCSSCEGKEDEEDKLIQAKPLFGQITPLPSSVQRKAKQEAEKDEDEDKILQAKSTGRTWNTHAHSDHPLIRNALSSPGQPLDAATRSFMEPRFGQDFSGVRVHTGSQAARMNREMGAQAFTLGRNVYFAEGKVPGRNELTAHELTHVGQQNYYQQSSQKAIGKILQRDCDPSVASCLPESASDSSLGTDPSSQSAQQIEEAQNTYQATRDQLLEQGPYCDPQSSVFTQYCSACEMLKSSGQTPEDEPQGVFLPGDQMLVVDESGQVQLLTGDDVVQIGEDLFPVLDDVANASQSGQVPSTAMVGSLEQVLLWSDGRAVLTLPVSTDLASLLIQGQPVELESATGIGNLDKPWERVQDASIHSLLTSGLYQLGSHPISRFNGVTLPAGSRIRFADVGRLMSRQMETRLITIFKPGTNKFYAWDAHIPVGNKPHAYWHINQKGMSAGLFGQTDHAAMTAIQIAQARNLRYIRVGGRVLFVAGMLVDGYFLYNSAVQSSEQDTPRPLIAQAVRTVGGWGGAWIGAKLGCAAGALAGIETGPGLVLTCIAGGIIGGIAGYAGADWIADMISED